MPRFNPHAREKGITDELRWYETLFCCCKCRAQCKSCVTTTFLYFVPIVFLISLGIACLSLGIITVYWNNCSYQPVAPYWVILSAFSPLLLLPFIKAVKEEYYGCTLCRGFSLMFYVFFLAWMVLGSIWIFNTFANATSHTCNDIFKYFAFSVVCFHWLLFLLATIPQVYILMLVCCCCSDNAIKPLKHSTSIDYGLDT